MPARGRAAFAPAIRLGVLLLSAAALPVSWQCSLISVYRGTHQCGECNNAAFGTQSAAVLTLHAPHGSRARLRVVTSSRDSWRSHVHRTHTAQRVQSFKLQSANVGGRGALPSRSLWGPRGPFSHVREWPPYSVQRPRRCSPLQTARSLFHLA